jgi:hypothetical protein
VGIRKIQLTVVAERAVGGDVDALLFGVGDEVVLRKQWMGFNLVGGLWITFLRAAPK